MSALLKESTLNPLPVLLWKNQPAGRILSAEFLPSQPTFIDTKRKQTGARKRGLRYEERVHGMLNERYAGMYVPSPWFMFSEITGEGKRKLRVCQPDGLIIDIREGRVTVVEMKVAHTADAYYQLLTLYIPVVSAYFNAGKGQDWVVRGCEICEWYDPHTYMPRDIRWERANCPQEVTDDLISIHVWNPRYDKVSANG